MQDKNVNDKKGLAFSIANIIFTNLARTQKFPEITISYEGIN